MVKQINHTENVVEFTGNGCAWKATYKATNKAGDRRWFVGPMDSIQEFLGDDWFVSPHF